MLNNVCSKKEGETQKIVLEAAQLQGSVQGRIESLCQASGHLKQPLGWLKKRCPICGEHLNSLKSYKAFCWGFDFYHEGYFTLKVWYCPKCGYEFGRGRTQEDHSCLGFMWLMPLDRRVRCLGNGQLPWGKRLKLAKRVLRHREDFLEYHQFAGEEELKGGL